MRNAIIKFVFALSIIGIYMGCEYICSNGINIFAILTIVISLIIFKWFISVNQNYFQKKVNKMLGR